MDRGKKKEEYIIVFLIIIELYLHFSFWLNSTINATIRYSMMVAISITLLLFKKKFRVNIKVLGVIFALLSVQVLSMLLDGGYGGVSTGLLLMSVNAFLFVSAVRYDDFQKAFRIFMITECICSCVVYFGYLFMPSLFDFFPIITTWRNGRVFFKNVYVSLIPVSMMNYYRNFGIFVEPGMHAIIVAFALMEELFYKKTDVKVLILYIVTIISTVSTSGIIVLAALIVVFMIDRAPKEEKGNGKKIRRYITMTFLVGVICFFVLYQNGIITSYIFDKLLSTDASSGYDRRVGYEVMIKEFINNPILGMGMEKAVGYYYIQKGIIQTFTVLNWFGVYGIVYGTLCVLGLYKYVYRRKEKSFRVILGLFAAIILLLVGQDFSKDFFVLVLILYGYSFTRKNTNSNLFRGGEEKNVYY